MNGRAWSPAQARMVYVGTAVAGVAVGWGVGSWLRSRMTPAAPAPAPTGLGAIVRPVPQRRPVIRTLALPQQPQVRELQASPVREAAAPAVTPASAAVREVASPADGPSGTTFAAPPSSGAIPAGGGPTRGPHLPHGHGGGGTVVDVVIPASYGEQAGPLPPMGLPAEPSQPGSGEPAVPCGLPDEAQPPPPNCAPCSAETYDHATREAAFYAQRDIDGRSPRRWRMDMDD